MEFLLGERERESLKFMTYLIEFGNRGKKI